jgi:hypothetical protein
MASALGTTLTALAILTLVAGTIPAFSYLSSRRRR